MLLQPVRLVPAGTNKESLVDDLLILAIGRSFVELAAQREQALQANKQLQEQLKATPKPETPKEN